MKKQGHISGHMSLLNIAKKHGVTDSELRSELKKGIKVEQEHTSNVKAAARIALDHLFEDPKYYTKLARIKLENNILNEYSDKIINQLISKFKQEYPELTDDEIKQVITRFDQIKDNLPLKDILKYTWDELVGVIIRYEPKRVKAGKINKGEVDNADLVYNQNNTRIYKAGSKKACIKYGNGYSFCISARGEDNLYADYRLGGGEGDAIPAFPYFIFDDNKSSDKNKDGSFIDPTHLLVVMAHDPNEGGGYSITEADNEGDIFYNTFEKAAQKYPQLKGLKDVLKYEAPSNNDIEFVISQKNQAVEDFLKKNHIPYMSKAQIVNLLNNYQSSYSHNVKMFEFTKTEKKTKKVTKYLYPYPNIDTARFQAKRQMEYSLNPWINNPAEITVKEVPIEGKLKNILQDYVKLVDTYDKQLLKLKLQSLDENQSLKNKSPLNKELVKEFMKHVMNELRLDSLPKIKLSNDSQEAVEHGSWGGYNTGDQSIRIVTAKRHPADIFRTLAHELVHYKQDLTGRLQAGDGKTGSDVENEANSRAAIIMRNFAEAKPSLFEHLITELGDDLNKALPFDYIGRRFNEYIFNTDENEYKVAFKPDGKNRYERVYHTTNRPLGSNFEDTQEGKPLQINATVMKITLDFMKRNPDFEMIYILPLDSRRFNLVTSYIKNNLPSEYSFLAEPGKDENIIAIYNSPTPPNDIEI